MNALPALPPPTYTSARTYRPRRPGKRGRYRGYYARQSQAIYALQMREAIIRLTVEGYTDQQIADALGQSISTVRRYRRQSMERAIERYTDPNAHTSGEWDEGADPDRRSRLPPRGPGPGPHRPNSSKKPTEILDPPDVIRLRRECLRMRKALVPFDDMADALGISEAQARQYTAEALRHLNESELTNAELERRLMVEQLDELINAVHAPAVGRHPTLGQVPPVLEAVDRVLRLLKQKAELLGLNRPATVDIMVRLQDLAEEAGYDVLELHDIARDVLARHKLRLPDTALYAQPTPEPAPPYHETEPTTAPVS